MPRPIWFRSLYWRIALGFVAMLAALLFVQGMLFLWLTGRFALSTARREDILFPMNQVQIDVSFWADNGEQLEQRFNSWAAK